ncbi:cell division protein FtsQ [Nonlabens xylanidelens]|uniref:Cell division protein FtsQ n=1 Tax=Nonlabens xylanidelens TaxID=191564 RepID=A0A2S6IJN8_9FLAO|nr:cell division protein FtsQ/DivIB [Nonlabens xylanidelens]PPK94443.1 cell division protein FtsQ [Nonlabens xylanidelens]PQJ21398.1 cell division protein [Nonlabens xylanidelens]
MHKIKNIIKLVLVIVLVISLYAFASNRYEARKLKDVSITFTDYSDPLISEKNVNKLLIQNNDSIENLTIENLDLNKSELRLVQNAMIRDAEVSVSLDGLLKAVVRPRKPIARIMGTPDAYLDQDNLMMPLSKEHTVNVPLVYGFTENVQDKTFELINFIRNDELLKASFTQIKFDKREEVTLSVRALDFKVKLGRVEKLDHKMINYKAFLTKMQKDKQLGDIKTIDLRFDNQVVVTKR